MNVYQVLFLLDSLLVKLKSDSGDLLTNPLVHRRDWNSRIHRRCLSQYV